MRIHKLTDSRGTRTVSHEPVPDCHRERPLCIVDARESVQGPVVIQAMAWDQDTGIKLVESMVDRYPVVDLRVFNEQLGVYLTERFVLGIALSEAA